MKLQADNNKMKMKKPNIEERFVTAGLQQKGFLQLPNTLIFRLT